MEIKEGTKEGKKEEALESVKRAVIKEHSAVCPPSLTWCHRSNTVGMRRASSLPKDEKNPLTI